MRTINVNITEIEISSERDAWMEYQKESVPFRKGVAGHNHNAEIAQAFSAGYEQGLMRGTVEGGNDIRAAIRKVLGL